jgi:2-polyprenyl-3-methyl-5-hydroxy-6-metoxy-1,4-benzoquinol methylase
MSNDLDVLVAAIQSRNPLQEPFLQTSLAGLEAGECSDIDAYLRYCRAAGVSTEFLAESYDTIVRDTLGEQLYFRRHGRYRHATYAAVENTVYQNPDYMRRYMFGLALTSYLWPNHREIHRFFNDRLPRQRQGKYLEIGPGHGVFFLSAMRLGRFDSYAGIDISPTSVAMTTDLIASGQFGKFANFQITCADFLTDRGLAPGFSAVVMGEVLEHVEAPLAFLARIRELAAPGAFVFVTTAINAPAIDHIYCFESPESVHALVADAGLRIIDEIIVPYTGHTLQESQAQRLPVNIALILSP